MIKFSEELTMEFEVDAMAVFQAIGSVEDETAFEVEASPLFLTEEQRHANDDDKGLRLMTYAVWYTAKYANKDA